MILWLALFTFSALADEPSVEKYCYSSISEMKTNYQKAKMVFVPSDQVSEDENCLVIQMRPHRRELIQSYLRQLNPNVTISFSSAEIKRDPCKLKVEKIKNLDSNKVAGSANQSGISLVEETKLSQSVDTMEITTLNSFELMVNYESIKGECRFINPTRYEISLEVKKDPVPVIPAVAPGTVVILNSPTLPPPQQTSSLKTTLQLNSGNRIEIGSLVKDLKDKSGQFNSDPSASGQITDGANTEQVFLSIH